ncbi:MAG: hypothetical protein IKC35_03890 [Clostridia bacterium]|nr:hypothetical protein [Clostridia bacterium]
MHFGVIIAFCALSGVLLTLVSLKQMQILQLSSYSYHGVWAWLKRTKFDFLMRYFALAFFSFASMAVFVACFSQAGWISYFGFAFYVILAVLFVVAVSKQKSKTPLKITHRIWRLIAVDFILNVGLSFVAVWFVKDTIVSYTLMGVTPLLSFLTLMLSHGALLPLEKIIANKFVVKAVRKLDATKPLVVGITGSYGKTTAKKVLATFLHTKYRVFASPNSYNTPMGLSKCVNEEYNGEEIFIAEMGARHVGDIKYLKKIFKPQYAMVTGIGNQHLETFKTKENIVREKLCLLDGVKYAVANGDVPVIAEQAAGKADLVGQNGVATYSDVKTDINGTSFVLNIDGQSVEIRTRLVGDHIPVVLTMCAAMAYKLGVSLKKIKEAAEKLPFVDHRLEVLRSGEFIIFDDSYNSNPIGANNALRILDTYQGTKVIITPGFVELGAESEKCLVELGEQIAKVCDYAFLLGPNAEIIKKGMGDFGNVTVVGSLAEAMNKLKELAPPMAVLFENDLPDNY